MSSPHTSVPDLPAAALRVFTEVARLGSFTAAARELGYTQSAVSRQIASLEAAAGAPLVDRLPRGVRLTAAGHALLPHADAVLGRLAAARRDLTALRELTAGRVRAGAFATAQAWLLPRAYAAFRTRHPAVAVTVREGPSHRLAAAVLAGDLDVAVVSTTGSPDFEGLDLVRLLEDPMLLALPAGHRLAGRAEVALADVADEAWVASSPRAEDTLLAPALSGGFRPRVTLVVADWLAKLGFVAQGLGVTLLPSLAVGAVRPDVALVPLRPDELPVRTVYAATCRDLHRTAAAAAFLDVLRQSAGP
jgi:DNA-binding transcriptional LysR family regulator|nr:LysR substrate-binding domain-containing protein [Streptomyces sp. NBC_00899]WSX80352.1 LysR substrate-binding domain-containing protein [Streptomyces sp. NBC_00899]